MNTKPRRAAMALPGIATACALLLAAGRGAPVAAAEAVSPEPAKPFLLVEGSFDREYVSDLYTFTMDGKLIKRLTSEPLPTNHLVAVAPGSGDPYFVANASALYRLSLRFNILTSVHSANADTIAISQDGRTTAFVISPDVPRGENNVSPRRGRTPASSDPPFNLRVWPGLDGFAWQPFQFPLPAGVAPTEMTFTPDGEHLLVTGWSGQNAAEILLVDLRRGTTSTVLSRRGSAYYAPVFAPDGKSLLALREDFDAGRWFIVSLPWPATREPAIIVRSPRGVAFGAPMFFADGKGFLFSYGGAMARAEPDGSTVESLFGELETADRNWPVGQSNFINRANPARRGWAPRVVTRYFATVQARERKDPTATPEADVVVYDLQTRQRTVFSIFNGQVRTVVVVE